MKDKYKQLLKEIIDNRDKCFIPEEGDLYEWTQRAKEVLK